MPMVIMGHSFGTLLATGFLHFLSSRSESLATTLFHSFRLMISLCGIPFHYFSDLALYRDQRISDLASCGKNLRTVDEPQLLEMIKRTSIEMYGFVPEFFEDESQEAFFIPLQGKSLIASNVSLVFSPIHFQTSFTPSSC